MSHCDSSGRGDSHRDQVTREDGEEETGEVKETLHSAGNNEGAGGSFQEYPPSIPSSHHHRPPSPVGLLQRHNDFGDNSNYRGARGGGGARFGPRGRRQRQSFSAGGVPPFHRDNFRSEPKLLRDSSYGSSGGPPPPSLHRDSSGPPPPPVPHRDSSFGNIGPRGFPRDGPGVREPPFRDGPGPRDGGTRDGPFRDGPPPHHHGRDGPLFARASSYSAMGGMRDDFPPSNEPETVGGVPEIESDRNRPPPELTRDPSFSYTAPGLSRDSSFGQTGPTVRSTIPSSCTNVEELHTVWFPVNQMHSNSSNRSDNRAGNLISSPKPTGPAPPSRPTDPRRRVTDKDSGQTFPQVNIPPYSSNDGMVGIHHAERQPLIHDVPSGVSPPSPSQQRRHSSYISLASDGQSSIAKPQTTVDSFRSPVGRIRRAMSDTISRDDRKEFGVSLGPPKPFSHGEHCRSVPTGLIELNPSHLASKSAETRLQGSTKEPDRPVIPLSASQTQCLTTRTHDPRFRRSDGPNDEGARQNSYIMQSIPEKLAMEESQPTSASSVDPFGRTLEWTRKPAVAAKSASEGFLQSSPTSKKVVKQIEPSSSSDSVPKVPVANAIERNSTATVKENPLPPIFVSSLGSPEKIQRAHAVLDHFMEINQASPAESGDSSDVLKLPSKADIMSTVSAIEKLIKEVQKESEENENRIMVAKKKEDISKEKESRKLKEEQTKRKIQVEKRSDNHKVEENKLNARVDHGAQVDAEVRFDTEKKQLEEDFDLKLTKARAEKKKRCDNALEVRVGEASLVFDENVAKARRNLERFRSSAQKINKKLFVAESEFKAVVESEEKKTKKAKKKADHKNFVSFERVVANMLAENRTKAKEAQLLSFSMADSDANLSVVYPEGVEARQVSLSDSRDPKFHKTFEEWSILAMQVTGLSDALYAEPSETPYYERNRRSHELLQPLIKEYIRDKHRRLMKHWTMLAEEYEVRKRLYEKQQRKLAKKARGSITIISRPSIIGKSKEHKEKVEEKPPEPSTRPSNNPYRRARRGNEVRSEYEQEQIIAEIAAKEALEKRITHGGSRIPRQICPIERGLTAKYINTFVSQRIRDPLLEAQDERSTNIWTDMEKCIFLDRFLQFPKDFRRIASFLRNKTTRDCVAFYYDSKQTVPYKGALKEHVMRRKRKGDYQVWDASIQAALSVGGTVTAGDDEENPVHFSVPASDMSYNTRMLHPINLEVFDSMVIDESVAATYKDTGKSEDSRWRSRKRGRDPLFSLDKEQTKFLRLLSQESTCNEQAKSSDEQDGIDEEIKPDDGESSALSPVKKATQKQKWTNAEKRTFIETLEKHGRDWTMLANAVGTKSISQIKNFYYDYKKQVGKGLKLDKKGIREYTPKSKVSSATAKEEKPRRSEKEESNLFKKRRSPPMVPELSSQKTQSPSSSSPTSPPSADRTSTWDLQRDDKAFLTEEMMSDPHFHQTFRSRNREMVIQRQELLQRQQEMQEYQRRSELEQCDHPLENENHSNNTGTSAGSELVERLLSGSSEYSHNAMQQLLNRQQSQPQHPAGLGMHIHQQQDSQEQQPQQTALQQLFSRQNLQREQQHQQATQRSLEETRRFLEQQQTHQVLSNMFPGWPASQLYQSQSRMQQAQLAAALQTQDESGPAITDLADVATIQRLLQMQQPQHQQSSNPLLSLGQNHSQLGSLLGLTSAAGSGISAGILAQLEGLSSGRNISNQGDQPQDDLSAIFARYGTAAHLGSASGESQIRGIGNHLFRGTASGGNGGTSTPDNTPSLSDAFALLQRAMQRENSEFGSAGR